MGTVNSNARCGDCVQVFFYPSLLRTAVLVVDHFFSFPCSFLFSEKRAQSRGVKLATP